MGKVVVVAGIWVVGTLIARGRPPVGGGLFVYHHRSTVLTMPLAPLSRSHSTLRTPRESVPGARSASAYDHPTGTISTTTARATPRATQVTLFDRRRDR